MIFVLLETDFNYTGSRQNEKPTWAEKHTNSPAYIHSEMQIHTAASTYTLVHESAQTNALRSPSLSHSQQWIDLMGRKSSLYHSESLQSPGRIYLRVFVVRELAAATPQCFALRRAWLIALASMGMEGSWHSKVFTDTKFKGSTHTNAKKSEVVLVWELTLAIDRSILWITDHQYWWTPSRRTVLKA